MIDGNIVCFEYRFRVQPRGSLKSYVICKTGDGGREHIDVVAVAGHAGAIHGNHAFTANSTQGICPNIVRVAIYSKDVALAVLGSLIVGARCVIIIEEAVKPCAVNQCINAIQDTHAEGITIPRDT
jgi:hypothetical protein